MLWVEMERSGFGSVREHDGEDGKKPNAKIAPRGLSCATSRGHPLLYLSCAGGQEGLPAL